jgi:transporter family-2 protein
MTPAIIVGGLCGLVIIAAMALVFPKIGALSAITLFIAGQIAAALLITHFGILGSTGSLDPTKIIGALLTLVGVYLVLR